MPANETNTKLDAKDDDFMRRVAQRVWELWRRELERENERQGKRQGK